MYSFSTPTTKTLFNEGTIFQAHTNAAERTAYMEIILGVFAYS